MRLIIFLFLSLLGSQFIQSQEVTYIKGSFSGKNLALDILARVDQLAWDGQKINYEQKLNKQEDFWISFYMEQAQYIKLVYARNELEIFAEPGDTINITIDPTNFKYNSTLSGVNGDKNRILDYYYKNNNSAQKKANRLQFKYGNDLWYYTNTTLDAWMRNMDGQSFLNKMSERKDTWFKYLIKQQTLFPKAFTGSLNDYLLSEINFDWAYFMMIYGTIYNHRHGLNEDYLDFLSSLPIEDGIVASPRFRRFAFAYANYHYMKQIEKGNYLGQMYRIGEELYSGETLSFFISELLLKKMRDRDDPSYIDLYYSFINSNEYTHFSERVNRKFQKLIGISVGAAAPTFSLTDTNSKIHDLNEYYGKPILLDFWASWCKPCIAKFPELKELQEQFSGDFELILINLDKSENAFIQSDQLFNPPGINLFAPVEDQKSLMQAYGVKFLPGMLLLDKNGRFLVTPNEFDLDKLKEYLAKG